MVKFAINAPYLLFISSLELTSFASTSQETVIDDPEEVLSLDGDVLVDHENYNLVCCCTAICSSCAIVPLPKQPNLNTPFHFVCD